MPAGETKCLKKAQTKTGKAKGLAACNSQAESPFSSWNNFHYKYLPILWGSPQMRSVQYLQRYSPLKQRHVFGNYILKNLRCFLFAGTADKNFAAVNEMEGIAHKGKNFGSVYPKALVAVDKGMCLQSGQQLLGRLAAEHRVVELNYLRLMSCPLQVQDFRDWYALSVAPLSNPDSRRIIKAFFQSFQAFIQG